MRYNDTVVRLGPEELAPNFKPRPMLYLIVTGEFAEVPILHFDVLRGRNRLMFCAVIVVVCAVKFNNYYTSNQSQLSLQNGRENLAKML